jgi:8-oxo-dGTP pyrophosphatase MutT (NUDIX family)
MNDAVSIVRIERQELTFAPKPWAFAIERRAEIDAFFAKLQREKPALWNGRVLLMHRHALGDGVLRGDYLETDYASFSAWCAWGKPAAGVRDCFGAAAIIAADGAFLLGRMGAHTFNAGQIYFPCGTPDRSDLVGATVDLAASVRRELKEETGLDATEFVAQPGWTSLADGALLVQFKVFHSSQRAEALRVRILERLARQKQPEFSDICIVRKAADFDPAMPRYVTAFMTDRWVNGEALPTLGSCQDRVLGVNYEA